MKEEPLKVTLADLKGKVAGILIRLETFEKRITDIEKAFYESENKKLLKVLRKKTDKYLPRLKELVEAENDPKFTGFIQGVIDSYMMHECELGRSQKKINKGGPYAMTL